MPRIQGLNHLSLTVTDLARSRDWYERVLGFRVVNTVNVGGYETVVMVDPASGTVIALNRHPSNSGDPFSETRTGLDHLSFAVGDHSELDAWRDHLDRAGVAHSPVAEDPFGIVLVFRDPDNIQLELFSMG